MKRIFAWILTVALVVLPALSLTSCARKPRTEDIYDRVVELVENAVELNTVFYGAGLPVYHDDSTYAKLTNMYYDFEHAGSYEMVTPYAKFATVSQIKQAAEKVYSAEYLEKVVYPALFDGYAVQGITDIQVSSARYLEDMEWIYQSTESEPLYTGIIVYDYASMEVVAPSNRKACYVTMYAWMEDAGCTEGREIRLRLVWQEDNWYLDSFTGGTL